MYKKAGVVVGIVAMVAAGFIYWYSHSLEENEAAVVTNTPAASSTSKDKVDKTPPESVSKTSNKNVDEIKDNSTPVDSSKSYNSKPVSTEVVGTQTEGQRVFQEVGESDLGKPVSTTKEIMIVVKKKLILLDGSYGSAEGKQLVYAVDLLGNDNNTRLTLYLNKSAYADVALGDRLKVKYSVYQNSSGVKFPVVISAEKPE